jgi:hypothetical protein
MPSLLRPVAAAGALALCAALTACGGGSTTSSSTPAPPPTQSTATTPTATTPTATTPTATTPTGATPATITQVEPKAAARAAATSAARRQNFDVLPREWDARCTAVGGRDRAATWRCQVASVGGQCAGSVTAYAAGPGLARTRQVDVTCTR